MAEWSIASDLKSEEPKGFREFESHSLFYLKIEIPEFYNIIFMKNNE